MSDFWSNVIAANLQPARVLQPRLPTLFEPIAASAVEPLEETAGETIAQPRAIATPRSFEVHAQSAKQPSTQPIDRQHPIEPRDPIEPPRSIAPIPSRPIAATVFTPISTQTQHEQRETHTGTEQTIERETTHGIVVAPQIRSSVETTVEPREPIAPRTTNVINQSPRTRSTIEQSAPAATPTVNVTIGRIEVRATSAAPAAQPARRPSNVMTLEDYLHQRNREAQR